jgi:AhpD family alkylhydroperoxidase
MEPVHLRIRYDATVPSCLDLATSIGGFVMNAETYPKPTRELAEMRRSLSPDADAAFHAFSKAVFSDGALSGKMKQLIAVAVAHVTQCPYCITGHTKAAQRKGATPQELMEAVWVAAEMRAGGAFAHSTLMLSALESPPA